MAAIEFTVIDIPADNFYVLRANVKTVFMLKPWETEYVVKILFVM
jgi:hypothetical protein